MVAGRVLRFDDEVGNLPMIQQQGGGQAHGAPADDHDVRLLWQHRLHTSTLSP